MSDNYQLFLFASLLLVVYLLYLLKTEKRAPGRVRAIHSL